MGVKLSDEDQARVNAVIHRGVNSVDRAPFRVWTLFWGIIAVLTFLSFFSYGLAWWHGLV